jgi:hypothetical protein
MLQPCMSLRVKKYVAASLLEPKTGLNGRRFIHVPSYDALRWQRAERRDAPTVGPKPTPKVSRPTAPIEPERAESLLEAQRRKTAIVQAKGRKDRHEDGRRQRARLIGGPVANVDGPGGKPFLGPV